MNKTPLRVLIVEDSEFDARILVSVLQQGGYAPDYIRVETPDDFQNALEDPTFEVVLSDYNMPDFSAPEALEILQNSDKDIPFIIISGGIGEDIAVNAMKAGAHDYLMKGQLARLVPAVERELREANIRRARRKAEDQLRDSELRYRMLWENSTDAVLMMDERSNICFANPAVEKVFGYDPADLIGKNLTMILPERADPDQEGFVEIIHSPHSPVHKSAHETIGLRKDHTQVVIEIAFNDLQFKGERWFVAFIRDVTARKEAERKIREHIEESKVAREIQQSLFPKSAPSIDGYDIAGVSYPAKDTGGDYFDYLKMVDGSTGLVVADVTGKGFGPAMLMAEARAFFRILANNRDDVGTILTRANQSLEDDLDFERYITVILVKLNPQSREINFVNAGHPKGLIFDSAGKIRKTLKRTGTPLGITPEIPYQSSDSETLAPGEILYLMTDGVDEAMSPDEEFFDDVKLSEVINSNREKSAKEIVAAIYGAINEFTHNAPQQDDVTMIVVKAL